ARGEHVVDPGLAASALSEGVSPLTERERQVLGATDRGADLDEIARALIPLQRHRSQPRLECHPETRRTQPVGGGQDRRSKGMVVNWITTMAFDAERLARRLAWQVS